MTCLIISRHCSIDLPTKPIVPDHQLSSANFQSLTAAIEQVHHELAAQAAKAVNVSLTVRNWLIGYYIAEYELNGQDRANYGEKLLQKLAAKLKEIGVPTCDKRRLYNYLRFYQTYPEIVRTAPAPLRKLLPGEIAAEPQQKVRTAPAQFKLLENLSYSQLELLFAIEQADQREFYEQQCIAGNWSVRELKRQIGSLLFERSELSTEKQKLKQLTESTADTQPTTLTIRDPYIFEFIGLKATEVMSESHLEDQLLNKLQQFLMELGQGFCFEARQQRILIGDTYNFVDLVFYHRILKCHVLVELKLEPFSHENVGQLNTYVSWYDKNIRTESDNPPIGILLCTEKDGALVEYALAGMDNELFVSKYELELPSKEVLEAQIEAERARIKKEQGD